MWPRPNVELLEGSDGIVESRFVHGMAIIRASINGHEPGWFLFDTGANMDMLTVEAAEKFGLETDRSAHVSGSSGQKKKIKMTIVDRVEFGPVTKRNMIYIIVDMPSFNEFLGEDIDGIIGARGLEWFTIDLDFPNRKVAITNERLDPDDPSVIEFTRRRNRLVYVPLDVLGAGVKGRSREFSAMLDSGAYDGLSLDTQTAKRVSRYENANGRKPSIGVHGIQEYHPMAELVGGLVLGNTTIDGALAGVDQSKNKIGVGIMRNFRVRIDGASGLVSFERSDGAKRLYGTETFGISKLWRFDGYRIHQIREGSVADLMGLSAFDQVVAIDGKAPTVLVDHTSFWTVAADATTVTVRVVREADDSEVDVVLPLDWATVKIERREKINSTHKKVTGTIEIEDGEKRVGKIEFVQ